MFTATEIVQTLESMRITHVIWVPDSTLGLWEDELEASTKLDLIRVCREGEAWPLAAGLHVGGKFPLIMMQSTGFFESGDAMRNVVHDLQLPIFAIMGVRNWLHPNSQDSARRFAEPITTAWGLNPVWITAENDKPRLEAHYEECQREQLPGLVLMAEGKG
jgi:sulfopyruvate decarboxylase TPP-binding subunit